MPYADPQRKRENNAVYRGLHREKAIATSAAWRAAHPGYRAASRATAAYMEAQRERANKWREAHPSYNTAYHTANAVAIRARHVTTDAARYAIDPEPYYARNRQRRARKLGNPGSATATQIKARWAMWGDRCWMCGATATCTDHHKPVVRGGPNWPSNLRPACQPCNSSKHDKWPYPIEGNRAPVAP